jgi:hypothetical protein
MQALLSELNSIPKSFQYLNKHTMTILDFLQNAKYENKKRRLIKILQSVNPNLTMVCLKDTKTQILYDGKVGVRCDVYANTKSEIYCLELEFDRSLLGNYKFTNPLTFQRNVCSRNNFIYDGVDIDKLIKLYYTKKEFIVNAPSTLISIIPNELINLIYSYMTSSLIFT